MASATNGEMRGCWIRSNDRLPARFVFALPERHGCIVVANVAVVRVTLEHLLRPVGNIAEMTEQRAAVSFLDLGAQAEVSAVRIAAMK